MGGNVLKGAQGSTATAATIRGHLKNSPAVDHAVMYPSSNTTSKNLPVGGNTKINSPINRGENEAGSKSGGRAGRMGGE